jgi:hypothetical protein
MATIEAGARIFLIFFSCSLLVEAFICIELVSTRDAVIGGILVLIPAAPLPTAASQREPERLRPYHRQ